MSPQHKNNSTNFKTSLQSITSAVTAMKGIKAGAYIGSNGLFDSATVNAYRASIKGLSATQAEAALSASGLNAAQRQQILTSKESTVANAGQATSFNVLTKAVWANVKAMAKWLVTTPTGWITLAIGATVGLITAYNNVEKKQNELIENARNLQEEYRSFAKDTAGKITSLEGQAEEFNKLAKGVDKYGNNISLASDEYDRYKSIVVEILGYSPELIQGYDAEGNAIADKNGLLERSIELLKEEQRLKLKEMTTDEKTGEAYDAAEAGWQQVQGYEGANTRNQIARWFDDNALRGGVNYEVDIAKVLGIKDEWKEEGNNLQNAIINNIDTVVKNIKDKKAELLAISDSDGNAIFSVDEIDSIIDLSNDWQYAYNQWQQDIEDAKHGMDDQFDLYAQRAKSYNDLTDSQKVFVNEYIRATGDITDAEGHLLSEDKILEKAKGYEKFVNEFAELNKLGEGGSVDLTFRPEIDTEELNKKGWEAGEGFATVFSSAISNTDFDDLIPENAEDTVAINFTPIIVDPNTGEFKGVLSEEELYAYAHDVLAGVREDDLNLQIGTKFEGKNAIDEAVADGERIHYLHEKLFINNDTVDSWEELRKVLVKTGDDAVQAGENANKMTVSLSELESASDKISKLSSAFKELSDDGYITTKTIGEIQEATGLAGDEWAGYEQKLLNAKRGSAEFNQVMSDLTYKIVENAFAGKDLTDVTEDQISAILRENGVVNANAVAHDIATKAKAKEKAKGFELCDSIDATKAKLIEEAKSCGISTAAYAQLVAQETIFNNNTLDISDKVAKLASLQQSLGQTTSMAIGLNNALAGRNLDDRLEMAMAIQQYGIKRTGKGYEYNGVVYKSGRDAVNAAMTDDFTKNIKVDIPKIVTPDYGGSTKKSDSNKSSSDKTPPKDETPFDDSYYSTIDAWIEENEKQIDKFEKDREALNRQFENALDTGNKEQAEILRDKLAENAKMQKDILHQQNEAHRLTQGQLLQSLYLYAPSFSSKSWDEISEVDLVNIENELNRASETASDDNKNQAKYKLNQFKGIVDDLKTLNDVIEKNSEAWRSLDDDIKGYWQSLIDFQDDYSNAWIDNQKAFDKLSEKEELAAYDRMINNNKAFQKQILNDTSISTDAKLALIKDTNDKILEIEKNAYNLRKGLFDKSTDFGSSYIDSQKTLLQSYYDVTNSITEAQHEINKELETSKTMYEWLDEETRKLLFNQEDYNVLSEELYDIQYKADKLRRQYERDLEKSTLSTIEDITSNYEMQYKTLMKSYEIAKADLEIAKKKQKLNNVLNERNVSMFIDGEWRWVSNTQDVANAKSELADAEYAKRVEESGLVQQQSINNLTKQQDELGVVVKKFENGVIQLDEAIRQAEEAIGGMSSTISAVLKSAKTNTNTSYSYGSGSSGGSIGGLMIKYDSGTDYMAKILASDTVEQAKEYNKLRNAKLVGLGKANEQKTNDQITEIWEEAHKNRKAKGTNNAKRGWTELGEEGFEVLIDSSNHLIPVAHPTIANLNGGEIVFNSEQMKNLKNLWDMAQFGNIAKMPSPNLNIIPRTQEVTRTIDNSVTINGMTVDSGSQAGQDLINALRRYVPIHT